MDAARAPLGHQRTHQTFPTPTDSTAATDASPGPGTGTATVSRRRLLLGGAAVAGLSLAACSLPASRDTPRPPSPTAPPTDGHDAYARPPEAAPDRPGYHLTPPAGWMNDPQRPLLVGGAWHLWYLFNADHPTGNGTEWRLATSTDLVAWSDGGVAIAKYTDDLGDVESGSAVVDTTGAAGLGPGTVVAMATQQADGVQRQSLFASRDGGRSFERVPGNPVLDNPGSADFRDPKIVRDDAHDQWVMVLAEGHRLGFYTSTDLRRWTYRSDHRVDDLGTLECPDLFELDVDGDPGRRTWVLLASANGAARGRTTGVAYWTGRWDGTRFTTDGATERWLDHGPDLYAAVTWADDRLPAADRHGSRLAIGWLDNWAYARERPVGSHAGGAQSVVRRIRLTSTGAAPVLTSRPVEGLDALTGPALPLRLDPAGGRRVVERPTPSDSLRLEVDLESAEPWALRLHDAHGSSVTLDVAPGRDVTLSRSASSAPDRARSTAASDAWTAPQRGPLSTGPRGSERSGSPGRVRLIVLVDRGSVEAFTADGALSLSAASGLDDVTTIGLDPTGPSTLHAATAAPIRPVQLA